jgi:hypothetical protein
MIIKDLSYKQIIDIDLVSQNKLLSKYCLVRNNNNIIYLFDINYEKVKGYQIDEIIIDMCCGYKHSLLLTNSGKVYEFIFDFESQNDIKDMKFELKYFKSNRSGNKRIVMISCGFSHSLALTESGRVFGWGDNRCGQLGVKIENSMEPIRIELKGLKIKKLCCGPYHSLLLSRSGNIYAFGWNRFGEVGNGTKIEERLPIKVEHKNKFIDIASHPYYSISMSKSIDGIYYVWGKCGKKSVLRPQKTDFDSFCEILRFNNINNYCKSSESIIEFEDCFVRNGYYMKNFEQVSELGYGSFGTVVKAKDRENAKYSAIKIIDFNREKKYEIIREYLNFSVINRMDCFENKFLVKHFDAWFEESSDPACFLSFYIKMELCDGTLVDFMNEIDSDPNMKIFGILTTLGYFLTSQIFIQLLECVDYLHTQNPPLIHCDLKPSNILLKNDKSSGRFVKLTDFGLMVIHKYSKQSHFFDKGTPKYMAPEVINNRKYNTKADIYSLGVIFQKMFDLQTDG